MSEPFLSPNIVRNKPCFLSGKDCGKKQSVKYPTKDGWINFKDSALLWSVLSIPVTNEEIEEYVSQQCTSHGNSRISFRNRLARYECDYLAKSGDETVVNVVDAEGNRDSNTDCTRRGIPRTQAPKNICFICNEARDVDSSKYSEGGLGRCEHDRSKETILTCQDFYKSNPTHDYYQASQRLHILLSGTSYAIFSQDVYYHHPCYRRFTKMAKPNKENQEDVIT